MTERASVSVLEELSDANCLELLGRSTLGRISIVVGGQPQIFPVNYAMSGRLVVFRTGAGTKLFHAPEAKVAFEIDDFDPITGIGWSVMVQGIAHDATDVYYDVSWAAHAASPEPLAPRARVFVVAVEPTMITGRRFAKSAATA